MSSSVCPLRPSRRHRSTLAHHHRAQDPHIARIWSTLPNKQSTSSPPPTFGFKLASALDTNGNDSAASSPKSSISSHSAASFGGANRSDSRLPASLHSPAVAKQQRHSPLVTHSATLHPDHYNSQSLSQPVSSELSSSPGKAAKMEQREENTEDALAEIFSGHPRPHLRAPSFTSPSFSSPPLAPPAFPRRDSVEAPRSYFSSPANPPQPQPLAGTRSRSQSSAPTLDALHQTGFRPDHSAWRSAQDPYSGSIPNRPAPISIASETSIERSRSREREGSIYSSSYSSSRGIGIGSPPSAHDSRTGWRPTTDSKAASYAGVGWNDDPRYGKGRYASDWGPPSLSTSVQSGIGLSNMSPFSRGLAELANNPPDWRARRDYSLGAVGSGRKRGESAFDTSRAVREAENEDDDAFAAPTKSGATSRRHSVATFDRPSRSQFGFEMTSSRPTESSNRTLPSAGFGASAISDDDLAADLNSLRLNLEEHAQRTGQASTSPMGDTPTPKDQPQLGSLQLYSPEFPAQKDANTGQGIPPLPPSMGPIVSQGYELPPAMAASRFGFAGETAANARTNYAPAFAAFGQPAPPFFTPATMPMVPPPQTTGVALPSPFPGPARSTGFAPPGAIPTAAPATQAPTRDESGLGRGVPLHSVPPDAALYIVEFKAGRKDLFFSNDPNLQLRQGDLVIVEADRGKDLGKFFKPCSLDEVQAFQQRLVEMALGQLAHGSAQSDGSPVPSALSSGTASASAAAAAAGGNQGQTPSAAAIARITKEFAPKRLYGKAQPSDTQLLLAKAQDEVKALALVRSKVAQKNLPMEVCDAEWQFDHKKLTLYYTSRERVDFRELVRELFRTFKARIWMCCIDQQSSAWDFK